MKKGFTKYEKRRVTYTIHHFRYMVFGILSFILSWVFIGFFLYFFGNFETYTLFRSKEEILMDHLISVGFGLIGGMVSIAIALLVSRKKLIREIWLNDKWIQVKSFRSGEDK
jgi:small-conductance mechanosensitive channel